MAADDARSQGISGHCMHLVVTEYYALGTRNVNKYCHNLLTYMIINRPRKVWNLHTVRLLIQAHLSKQYNCWSLKSSWSIACRRRTNHILILDLTHGFSGLNKDNYKTRQEICKFWDSVQLILDVWWQAVSHLCTLQWRHNGRSGVSNHQPHDCLLNRLFRHRSKKTSKIRVTGLCARNLPVIGKFPAQMASNAENVSISWRHHGNIYWGIY